MFFVPSFFGFQDAGKSVPLLDEYPGAAAAYSLRKLRTAYTGSAIRVRRTDLSEANIGFTSNGELDTTALLSFTGTGALDNGFITTWYDQSGNGYNATQTTALNQPQIVSSGSLILDNNKVAMEFDGANTSLDANTLASVFSGTDKDFTNIGVYNTNNTSLGNRSAFGFGYSVSGNDLIWVGEGNSVLNQGRIDMRDFNLVSSFVQGGSVQNQSLVFTNGTYDNLNLFINNSNIGNSSVNLGNIRLDKFSIGCLSRSTKNIFWIGFIQEIIIYNLNQSSNRTGIENNINSFYSIY